MRLITLKEVAHKLNVSEAAVYRLIKRNKIPYVEVGGVFRFDPDAIDKWIASGGTNAKD